MSKYMERTEVDGEKKRPPEVKGGYLYKCRLCGHATKSDAGMYNHLQSKHREEHNRAQRKSSLFERIVVTPEDIKRGVEVKRSRKRKSVVGSATSGGQGGFAMAQVVMIVKVPVMLPEGSELVECKLETVGIGERG
jgi:hypothetical protein